jgi:archaemetzincin
VTPTIRILNASSLRQDRLLGVAKKVGDQFLTEPTVSKGSLTLKRAFDSSRGQYNSTLLLAELLYLYPFPEQKTIAIVDVDLFIPVLTFVFGEAQLRGQAAVVSAARLGNRFYGLPEDDDLLLARLEKEIVHELGHTFGLYHCHQFECVMRSSTYVEEIDLKRGELCRGCQETTRQMRDLGSIAPLKISSL